MKEISLSKKQLQNIYADLGEPKIREILTDFYRRMSTDLMLGFFFTDKDLHPIVEQQLKFLLRAMGSITSYSGKPPANAHTELPPILSGHFDRRLVILRETLNAHHVNCALISTWLTFEESFRDAVVTSK